MISSSVASALSNTHITLAAITALLTVAFMAVVAYFVSVAVMAVVALISAIFSFVVANFAGILLAIVLIAALKKLVLR